jgi:hypothetical protein
MKYILSEIYFCGKLNDERKELLYFYFLNKLIKGTKKKENWKRKQKNTLVKKMHFINCKNTVLIKNDVIKRLERN